MKQEADKCFNFYKASIDAYALPERFTFPLQNGPHPLCLLAALELQQHLTDQNEWQHNFGLVEEDEGKIVGKMFGVLVVKNEENEIGYLAAFSGKLAGGNHHVGFVPPVFDGLAEGSFVNHGMTELSRICASIAELEELNTLESQEEVALLKQKRWQHSFTLQGRIFDAYTFTNQFGENMSLRSIFKKKSNGNPPAGAGECAAPKLIQYAFQNKMKPLALAEFWWGKSPKTEHWKHGEYYPACTEKCFPILSHMLEGMEWDGLKEVTFSGQISTQAITDLE